MNVDIFYKTPKDLEKAAGYVSPVTGELLSLKTTDKRVIVYLLDRLNFFVDRLGGDFFETQSTIASALGLEYQVVGKSLRGLIENRFILAGLRKPEVGKMRWFYDSVNTDVKLWVGTKENPTILEDSSKLTSLKRTVFALEDFDSPF